MPTYGELAASRPFRPYLFAGAFSFAAPSTVTVILAWAAATAYPSSAPFAASYAAVALALIGLSATVPTLAAAVFSGTVADRSDLRRLMAVTNALTLLATVGLFLDLLLHPSARIPAPGPAGFYLPEWLLIALPLWATFITAVTFFRPAFNTSLPRVLPSEMLGRGNGLVYGIAVGASVGGTLIATALISWLGLASAVVVPLILLGLTELAIVALRVPPTTEGTRARARFTAEVGEGYRFLAQNRALLAVTAASLLINFLTALAFVELGLYARLTLGATQAIVLGALTTGASLGSGAGTLLAGRLGFERRAGRYLIGLTAAQGATVAALSLSGSVWESVPLMFLFGIFPGMASTIFLATIQAVVPRSVLGRVLAADEVGSYGMVPIGQYAGGAITLWAGVRTTFLIAGSGTLGVAGAMAAFRELRSLGFVPQGHTNEIPPEREPTVVPSP